MTRVKISTLIVAIAGCSGREPSPPPPPSTIRDVPVTDAAPDAPDIDASVAATPTLACSARMEVKGSLQVTIDASTLRGEIVFYTAGPALTRHLKIVAKVDASTATLVFDGYFADDHQTIRRIRRPRPANERLVVGKSIVGQLATVGGEARFYVDGDVDWVTGTMLDINDGYAVCRR